MMKKTFLKKIAAFSLVAVVAAIPAVSFASDVKGAGKVEANTGIKALNEPLSKLGSAMTGSVPKIGVTVAAAGGALSWAMGTEQQIVKYATRAAMGGGIAIAAPSVINDITDDGVGCEM